MIRDPQVANAGSLYAKSSDIVAPGLQLIASTSFTDQTIVDINNCFSSTYISYCAIITITGPPHPATNNFLQMRYGNSAGFDDTTKYGSFLFKISTNGTGIQQNNNYSGTANFLTLIGGIIQPIATIATIDIHNPQLASVTTHTLNAHFTMLTHGISHERGALFGSGGVNTTTQYTSLRLLNTSAAIMTGNISIYGYR
jgi:hypothetical protein